MATRGRAVTDPTMGGWETSFTSSLRSRSKALKGGMASRESLFAAGGNAVNPMVVSRAQQTCTVVVEQAVGVVRNHEDGTWSAPGRDDPKASRWQHRRTGSGLYERARRRGDLWKTPREEFRCRRHRNARTQNASGKWRGRSRGWFRSDADVFGRPCTEVVEGPRGAVRAVFHVKATDGGGKPMCRDFVQVFPPRA